MKKLSSIVIILISLSMFSSCGQQNDTFDNDYSKKEEISSQKNVVTQLTNESEVDRMNLITKDELIELCDLSESEYIEKDLDSFINDFSLTKENISKYNIHALLKNYTQIYNVEYLFEDNKSKRKDNFTEDIIAIAFKENKNTTINSVYIDVDSKQKWAYEGADIFFDLNSYESKSISIESINTLIKEFDEFNLFSLENKLNSEGIIDPMSFTYIIKYSDGTYFSVERSGMPSEICPGYYSELYKIMFE